MNLINMGTTDRILRAVLGVAILGLGFAFKSWWGLIGLIPLGTAVVRVCPAYLPFGISTRPKSREQKAAGEAPGESSDEQVREEEAETRV